MSAQELTALLIENIQFQYRHECYDRALEIRKFSKMIVTGEGQEDEVTRYRRFEKDDLKKQRARLYNSLTKYVVARPRSYFKKMFRIEGIRIRLYAPDQQRLADLKKVFDNFQDGKDLQRWLNEKLEYLGAVDPNSWVVYERFDKRGPQNEILETKPFAWIVESVNALNFSYEYGELKWFLARAIQVETTVEKGMRREKVLENYYLYAPGMIARAREIGVKTIQEPGEQEVSIEVMAPAGPAIGGNAPDDVKAAAKATNISSSEPRRFLISVIENGTTEVPAAPVGVYYDEETMQNCFVTWFDPAEHVFLDLINLKSKLDTVLTVHTYPRRYEFVKSCQFTDEREGICQNGRMSVTNNTCPECGGTGKASNFTTEQEVLSIAMPDRAEDVVELSKYAFTEPVDVSLPKFLADLVKETEQRVMSAVFNSGIFEKPVFRAEKTAHEVSAEMEGISDVLKPFGDCISRHFELAYRIGAQYREIKDFECSHAFPEDLQVESLDDLVANYEQMKAAGVGFESLAAMRSRIIRKQYEGNTEEIQAIEARYRWLPFVDKTDEQQALIIAGRAETDEQRVLWENFFAIFQEIESENQNPQFHEMTYDKQRQIVDAKVAQYKERIGAEVAPAAPVIDQNAQPGATN